MVGGFLDNVVNGIKYYVLQFLSFIGFYTGAVINSSADIVGDTAKGGIDIAEGTVQSIGNLLQNRDNMNGPSVQQQQWNLSLFGWNPAPKDSNDDIQSQQKQAVQNTMDSVSPYIDSSVDKINNLNSKIIDFADEINAKGNELQELDQEINQRRNVLRDMPSESPSSSSVNWCPVGYENNKGQCMTIEKGDKCMYGKVFSTKEECEDNTKEPVFSGYSYQGKSVNWGTPPPPPPQGALTQKPLQPCPQIPGMCINQKPMCGPGKQLPIQMQTIPSRGQIQNGSSANAQQQQQKQLTPLPTFPQQQPFPQQQQQEQQNSPDMSNGDQSQYVNPIPGSSSNNFLPATPADNSGMIISPAPSVAPLPTPSINPAPAPSVTPLPTPSVSPSQGQIPTPSVSPAIVPAPAMSNITGGSLDLNKCGDHHHHSHSHDGNCNVSPGSSGSDSSNNVDLTGLETDIDNLNSVVKNLKSIQNTNDPSNDAPKLDPSEQYMKEMLQT